LLEAHPVSFVKNVFSIGFPAESEDHIGLVDNARNQALLQAKLAEFGHSNVQFKFVKHDAPARLEETARPLPEANQAVPAPAPTPRMTPEATPKTATTAPLQKDKEKLAPVPFNKDDFKNDPLIQKALELFKGQIVEVRA
jgi:hypothetical protein